MATDERKAKVILEVSEKGAKETSKALGNIGDSVDDLNKQFKRVATDGVDELTDAIRKDLGDALDDAAKQAGDVKLGGGGNGPQAAKFRGAAGIIGGENASNAVGVLDDIQDAFEGLSAAGESMPGILGSAAGALGALSAAALPIAALVIGVGLAFKLASDQAHAAQEQLTQDLDAYRTAAEAADKGSTVKDAQDAIDGYNQSIETQTRLLDRSTEKADAKFAEQADLYGDFVARLDIASGISPVIPYLNDINESTTNIKTATDAAEGYQEALDDGVFAANTAADAEKTLAEARTKSILDQAASAGQLTAAQHKADDATGEQNQARLDAIDDEKAALDAQIAVLEASGDTSAAVTDQIEKLTGQLGSLGAEADYISTTALAASKARDAEKKATKDAEDAAKKAQAEAEQNAQKAADAQQKYADSVKNAGTQFKQASEDINTKLGQSLTDNLTGLFRDATDIAQKYRRDTFDQDVKAQRDERDALTDHYLDLDDLREDALKNEKEAIQDGDFKALFLARQNAVQTAREDDKKFDREKSDRSRALQDNRADLLRDAQRTRADRLAQFDRQNSDSRLASQRELAQASEARQRSLAMASEANNADLRQQAEYLKTRNQMNAQANQQALAGGGVNGRGISGGGINGGGISGAGISGGGLSAVPIFQIMKKA